jgi:catechol 2,3-dioxygenase-like lactoylglutathione lyase family enzyme
MSQLFNHKPRTLRCGFLLVVLWVVSGCVLARAIEIHSVVLTVSDLRRSVAFYEAALGFSKVNERLIANGGEDRGVLSVGSQVRAATLKLGDETIELEQYVDAAGQPIPVDSRANDLWFQHFAIVVRDMNRAHAQLSRFQFQAISSAPQTLPQSNVAAAGIQAFKFKDPDGHPLELLHFPPGKGNPKWQRPTGRLFLGIDHSAITIASTVRSVEFYRDLLGLRLGGASFNSGTTQDRLDDVPGALVRITGLRAESEVGPGLEFLEYVRPSGGREAPPGLRVNDIAHVRVVLEVDDIDGLVDALERRSATSRASPVACAAVSAFGKCRLVRDPDGHVLMLVQR